MLFLSDHRIKSITDDAGTELTKHVLRDRASIGEMPTAVAPSKMNVHCFRPQPLPKCRSYFVFDFGYAYPLDKSTYSTSADKNGVGSLDLGYMRNLSAKNAVGFSAVGIGTSGSQRFGVRARYRRWISHSLGLDGTAGLVVVGNGNDAHDFEFPAPIASLGLQAGGLFGVTLEMEQVRYHALLPGNPEGPSASEVDWRVGGHLGSAVGAAATFGLALFAIAALSGF